MLVSNSVNKDMMLKYLHTYSIKIKSGNLVNNTHEPSRYFYFIHMRFYQLISEVHCIIG